MNEWVACVERCNLAVHPVSSACRLGCIRWSNLIIRSWSLSLFGAELYGAEISYLSVDWSSIPFARDTESRWLGLRIFSRRAPVFIRGQVFKAVLAQCRCCLLSRSNVCILVTLIACNGDIDNYVLKGLVVAVACAYSRPWTPIRAAEFFDYCVLAFGDVNSVGRTDWTQGKLQICLLDRVSLSSCSKRFLKAVIGAQSQSD